MDACHTYHMTILGLYSKIKSSPKIFNMLFTKYPALKITKLFCHPPLKMCSWVQEFFRVRWIQFPSLFSQWGWTPSSFSWFSSCLKNTVSGGILVPPLQVWTAHFWLIKAQSMLLQTKTAHFNQRKSVWLNKHQGRDPMMTVDQIICTSAIWQRSQKLLNQMSQFGLQFINTEFCIYSKLSVRDVCSSISHCFCWGRRSAPMLINSNSSVIHNTQQN